VSGGGNGVGGIAGYARISDIVGSTVAGTVTGTGNSVGGLVGFLEGDLVEDCASTATVRSTGITTENIGGLAGGIKTTDKTVVIKTSFATGSVSGAQIVGGLVGGSWVKSDQPEISNSYAQGKVTGTSKVGSLVGELNSGFVSNSYATGEVTASTYVSGFVGYISGTDAAFALNHFDRESTGKSVGYGGTDGTYGKAPAAGTVTAQFTEDMWHQATFVGDDPASPDWDFERIWSIDEGKGYPVLRPSISAALVAPVPDQLWTGSEIIPSFIVTLGEKTLAKGTDYTVAAADNTAVGNATATLTGTGSYRGKLSVPFRIVESSGATPSSSSAEDTSSSSSSDETPSSSSEAETPSSSSAETTPILSTPSLSPELTYKLYNLQGNLVQSGHGKLNLRGLQNGVYVVRRQSGTQVLVVR
jgi:hypothetical protein